MNRLTLCVALAAAMGLGASIAHADSFTYHGSLQDAGKVANGSYDMQLTLYSAQTGGHVVAGPLTLYAVSVKDGNFVTNVDFGPMASLTSQGWVDVKVKPANAGNFIALDSRSPVAAPESACPGSWAVDGNAGNPGGSYLGTADTQPLSFKVNGAPAGAFYQNTNGAEFYVYGATSLAYSDGAFGANSLAAGFHGQTVNEGSFDWSPQFGTITSVLDTATEQFIVNAPHGVGINTATAPDGTPLRDELTIAPSPDLPAGNADITLETSTQATGYNGFNISAIPNGFFQINGLYDTANALSYDSLLYVNYTHFNASANWQFNGAGANGPISVGHDAGTGNGAFLSATGIWTNASSRTFKDAFAAIDPVAVLQKLVAMPVKTWFYKGNHPDGQHMGPVAEEFAETFGLGSNEKYIGTVDESGVALAAIQGLNKKVEAENTTLRHQNAELRGTLDAVVARLDKLESPKGE